MEKLSHLHFNPFLLFLWSKALVTSSFNDLCYFQCPYRSKFKLWVMSMVVLNKNPMDIISFILIHTYSLLSLSLSLCMYLSKLWVMSMVVLNKNPMDIISFILIHTYSLLSLTFSLFMYVSVYIYIYIYI